MPWNKNLSRHRIADTLNTSSIFWTYVAHTRNTDPNVSQLVDQRKNGCNFCVFTVHKN